MSAPNAVPTYEIICWPKAGGSEVIDTVPTLAEAKRRCQHQGPNGEWYSFREANSGATS